MNLIAFDARFTNTWRKRPRIAEHRGGDARRPVHVELQLFLGGARPQQRNHVARNLFRIDLRELDRNRGPASMREKSRMSLMMVISARPDSRMVLAIDCCSAFSGVCNSRSVKPMTPFIGVRISWLMVARNSLLALLASSAALRALISSASTVLKGVMS